MRDSPSEREKELDEREKLRTTRTDPAETPVFEGKDALETPR